ncbi:Ff.00g048500.m01.CDS01 [Fusarium sp. VM40]|nr:Ff.00g048500.m01.CDS01 [Fusarium sp. VM40]
MRWRERADAATTAFHQLLRNTDSWVSGCRRNATKAKVGWHPLNGREAGGAECECQKSTTPNETNLVNNAPGARNPSRWMMPDKDAEKDA